MDCGQTRPALPVGVPTGKLCWPPLRIYTCANSFLERCIAANFSSMHQENLITISLKFSEIQLIRVHSASAPALNEQRSGLLLLAAVRRARRASALRREEVARLTLRVHRVQAACASSFRYVSAWIRGAYLTVGILFCCRFLRRASCVACLSLSLSSPWDCRRCRACTPSASGSRTSSPRRSR